MFDNEIARSLIYLPEGAQLSRMRGLLHELSALLEGALEPARRFKPDPGTQENDLRLAVALHALNALDAGHAVHNLSGTDYPATLAPHYRTIFEALVKIRWMRMQPKRARRFLQSAPFERYLLATTRVQKSKHWASIVEDCKRAIESDPELLALPRATKGKRRRPNFAAIASELRMPELGVMAKALGMDDEDYLIDHAVPSLTPHTSVLHVSNFAKRQNGDGTVSMSTMMDPNALLAYVARAATRTGEILHQVLELFPDGKVMYDSEKVAARLSDVTHMLRSSMPR